MKNNKTTQIFLAIALLGIWGTIFYRVYVGMESDGENNFQTWQLPIIDTTAAIEEAGFALRMDYGDPFFGKNYEPVYKDEFSEASPSFATSSITQAPPVTNIVKKKNIKFPEIIYQGLVTNKQTNQKVAILKINQKTHRLKSGQQVNDIRLVQMSKDSVRIYYKGETKTFVK